MSDDAIETNRANRKKVATIHLVMVMGALTLWGAADAWAVQSGWGLARVAISSALGGRNLSENTASDLGWTKR